MDRIHYVAPGSPEDLIPHKDLYFKLLTLKNIDCTFIIESETVDQAVKGVENYRKIIG